MTRPARRIIFAIGVIVGSVVGTGQAATAQVDSQMGPFTVTAEADGMNVVLDYPGELPVVQSVSASPWGSSAALDSLGSSTAAAGAPYSPFVYSLPGTFAGLVGSQLPPLPAPPGEVSSSYPTSPSVAESDGPYSLTASSGSTESEGLVAVGGIASGGPAAPVFSSSETKVEPDGQIAATATGGVDGLDLSGILDLANVSSTATISEKPASKPAYKGSTRLGTVTISGTTLGVTDSGLAAGGSSFTEPLTPAVIPALNTALASSGIKLAYLSATYLYADGSSSSGGAPESGKTLQAVDSGALEVTFSHAIPNQGTPTVTYTLGRVFVAAFNDAVPGAGSLSTPQGNSGSPGLGVGGAGVPSGTPSSASGPSGISTEFRGETPGSGPASTGRSRGSYGTARPQAASNDSIPRSTGNRGGVSLTAGGVLGHTTELIYLILVVAALSALGGAQMLRYLAVRLSFVGFPRGEPKPLWSTSQSIKR